MASSSPVWKHVLGDSGRSGATTRSRRSPVAGRSATTCTSSSGSPAPAA
ncbi:MAG: hypothetical protein HS111_06705 [Kofleriaceae bacterium]|nr:hypothetical protein [Kofleriaceae bacterium]